MPDVKDYKIILHVDLGNCAANTRIICLNLFEDVPQVESSIQGRVDGTLESIVSDLLQLVHYWKTNGVIEDPAEQIYISVSSLGNVKQSEKAFADMLVEKGFSYKQIFPVTLARSIEHLKRVSFRIYEQI